MNDATIKTIVALICITLLECVALLCGIDGAIFTSVIGAICGIVGYNIHAARTK